MQDVCQCGKVAYSSKPQAIEASRKAAKHKNHKVTYTYQCDITALWHLSSRSRTK